MASNASQPGKSNSFICFDTEDDSREVADKFAKQVTQIAALTRYGEDFHSHGPDVNRFKKWLRDRPETIIYAHNLQYDLGNLFGWELDSIDVSMVGGRMISAKWRGKSFRDSFNMWPMSVKKLGTAFNLAKLDFDAHSSDYVFRDVEIICQAMDYVWQTSEAMGLRTPAATLGGLCVNAWRQWDGVNSPCTDALAREALYGGRVELWKPRNECPDVAYTDLNSLYPSVMTGSFPGPLDELQTVAEPQYGVISCTVRVPESEIAVLPYRGPDGMLLYPWGKFSGTWTVGELQAAVARGAKILKVSRVMGTNEAVVPYADFVARLYRMRLNTANEAERLFFKLLMNNLYGRLGASGTIHRSVHLADKNAKGGTAYGGKKLVECQMPPGEEANWAHAAYVTSYGRLQLLNYLQIVGAPRMIYCDTDSTIFDCPGRKLPFPIGRDLGQMKLEAWENACETHAPKTYSLGQHYKAKGVPSAKAQEFFLTGKAHFDLPFKFHEAIAFYDRGNTKRLSVWREVCRNKKTEYDRKDLRDGRYFPKKISA